MADRYELMVAGARPLAHKKEMINAIHAVETRGGGTPLCDLNGDVRPDKVWFSGCFVLNGVSILSLSVLNRVSLHELMA